MPIYKYECKKCGHTFEDLRGFNDPNPEACPECGAGQIERLISGGNFHLKGSGWYVTDYNGSSTGNSAGGGDSSDGDSSSQSSSSDGTEAA